MKTHFLILGFLVFSTVIQAQVSSTESLSRLEQKALKRELAFEREAEVAAMLQDTSFVIQVDRFSVSGPSFGHSVKSSQSGPRHWMSLVESDDYTVEIDRGDVVIKTGLTHQSNFPEDLGSIIQGEIRDLKVKPFRNFSRIRFSFSSSFGQYRFEGRVTNVGYTSGSVESLSTHSKMYFQGTMNQTSKPK